jgi:hypothetical protein
MASSPSSCRRSSISKTSRHVLARADVLSLQDENEFFHPRSRTNSSSQHPQRDDVASLHSRGAKPRAQGSRRAAVPRCAGTTRWNERRTSTATTATTSVFCWRVRSRRHCTLLNTAFGIASCLCCCAPPVRQHCAKLCPAEQRRVAGRPRHGDALRQRRARSERVVCVAAPCDERAASFVPPQPNRVLRRARELSAAARHRVASALLHRGGGGHAASFVGARCRRQRRSPGLRGEADYSRRRGHGPPAAARVHLCSALPRLRSRSAGVQRHGCRAASRSRLSVSARSLCFALRVAVLSRCCWW